MAKELKFPGVELATQIFGCWPSLHDAEIRWLKMDRAGIEDEHGPTVEFLIHCFEMTKKISSSGHFTLEKHTLVHFRFRKVNDLHLRDFNQQNAIFGLQIEDESDPSWEERFFKTKIEGSFGIYGSFHSRSVEILSAIPCDENGEPITK